MTEMLSRAFTAASQLPDDRQDALAALLLAEIDSDRRWDEQFAASGNVLAKLAAEAVDEHRAGRTLPLDPDRP